MIFKGIRKSFQNILYVSRISNVKNKKLKILSSLALSNLSVLFDIFIILYFSYLLSDKNTNSLNLIYKSVLDYLLDNNYLMILIVIFRFSFFYLDKLNLQKLTLEMRESRIPFKRNI